MLEELLATTPNVICCGDFNGEPFEQFYQAMKSKMQSAYFAGK